MAGGETGTDEHHFILGSPDGAHDEDTGGVVDDIVSCKDIRRGGARHDAHIRDLVAVQAQNGGIFTPELGPGFPGRSE